MTRVRGVHEVNSRRVGQGFWEFTPCESLNRGCPPMKRGVSCAPCSSWPGLVTTQCADLCSSWPGLVLTQCELTYGRSPTALCECCSRTSQLLCCPLKRDSHRWRSGVLCEGAASSTCCTPGGQQTQGCTSHLFLTAIPSESSCNRSHTCVVVASRPIWLAGPCSEFLDRTADTQARCVRLILPQRKPVTASELSLKA